MNETDVAKRGPTDWADWRKYRDQVVHPAGCIQAEDIRRARENAARYDWAREWVDAERKMADQFLEGLRSAYLEAMVEVTSPGCSGACPACMKKGLAWHPTGQWAWSAENPDQLTCQVCGTVFPHADYPETIAIQSSFDPRQVITYCDGPVYECHTYKQALPSPSSTIRARKLGYVTAQLRRLGRVYAVTEDAKYARGARLILLRFAEVYPTYLVCAGYGYLEYADCDPHIASERIDDLPTDEICAPPNKPDRKLHTGYWSASRNGSWGHEGGWEMQVAEAYDLTCTAKDEQGPVFSTAERLRIERDVLLEGTYLCVCEPRLTNKSIRGRCAAAMIGAIVGHPGLVRWGVDQFRNAIDGAWFLPDGGAGECSSYAIVVMTAVDRYMTVFRDYSDPVGYAPKTGERLDNWHACRDTRFGDCWQALLWSLQGDLTFPPLADTFLGAKIPGQLVELLASCYPRTEYLSLLKEQTGDGDLRDGWQALFSREPGFEQRALPKVSLPDVVFPFMSQGYLRSGENGRQGVAALNAADWGGHHQMDSLNLYLWQDGHELLSDLGYLWDHPEKKNLVRTFAHNLVMIDGQEQRSRDRRGTFHLFAVSPNVKVMEASSDAYAQARTYRRTCVQVDRGEDGKYLVDLFRVAGGQTFDYVFHGPNMSMQVEGLSQAACDPAGMPFAENGLAGLQNAQQASGEGPWRMAWTFDDRYVLDALAPGGEGETVIVGEGWGQRNPHNKDRGATLPYIVRRVTDRDEVVFVTVYTWGAQGNRFVRGIRQLPLPEGAPSDSVAVAIETAAGVDVVISQTESHRLAFGTPAGRIQTDARCAVLLGDEGGFCESTLVGGSVLQAGEIAIGDCRAVYQGEALSSHSQAGDAWFLVPEQAIDGAALVGHCIFVTDANGARRAYPIREVQTESEGCRLYTKLGHVGFEACEATAWEIPVTVHVRRKE